MGGGAGKEKKEEEGNTKGGPVDAMANWASEFWDGVTGRYVWAEPERRANFVPKTTPMMPADARDVNYHYPFENLVFEGGGVKGAAYVGVVKALEELGIYRYVRRAAGSSAGAMVAALVALGCPADYVRKVILEADLEKLIKDDTFGFVRDLRRLDKQYGLYMGRRLHEYLGELMEDITGFKDITLYQVYKYYGRELCITATDMSTSSTLLLHPKTHPNFPVRRALRISMSLPVFMAAWQEPMSDGNMHIFADGGILMNYPIQVFDNWFLSMRPEDSFFKRWNEIINAHNGEATHIGYLYEKLKNADNVPTNATLGFKIYSDGEGDLSEMWLRADRQMMEAVHKSLPNPPDTPLKRKRYHQLESPEKVRKEMKAKMDKFSDMIAMLDKLDVNKDGFVTRDEATTVLKKHPDWSTMSVDTLFATLDQDNDGRISFLEFKQYMETQGIDLMTLMSGKAMIHIDGLDSFLSEGFLGGLMSATAKLYLKDYDILRTVPLSVSYIKTTDFDMEQADKEWLIAVGYQTTKAWLAVWTEQQHSGSGVFSDASISSPTHRMKKEQQLKKEQSRQKEESKGTVEKAVDQVTSGIANVLGSK